MSRVLMTDSRATGSGSPMSNRTPLRWVFVTVLTLVAMGCLYLLWRVNANKLGSLYDYSVIANGNGYLEQGLRPYRDFFTPQQTLIHL